MNMGARHAKIWQQRHLMHHSHLYRLDHYHHHGLQQQYSNHWLVQTCNMTESVLFPTYFPQSNNFQWCTTICYCVLPSLISLKFPSFSFKIFTTNYDFLDLTIIFLFLHHILLQWWLGCCGVTFYLNVVNIVALHSDCYIILSLFSYCYIILTLFCCRVDWAVMVLHFILMLHNLFYIFLLHYIYITFWLLYHLTIFLIVSSDRSSYSDDVLVYIQRHPLFEILSINAFL